jgi:hypothetical protein
MAALAHHFAEAAVPGCAAKAADYALSAANLAADAAAWEQAVDLCDAGLGALERVDCSDDQRVFELLVRKAELLGTLAQLDLADVWKAGFAAFEAARRVGSAEALVRAAAAYNHPRRPSGEVGRQLCEEALAALGDQPDPRLRSLLLISLSQTGTASDAQVAAMCSEALELAREARDPATLSGARRLRAFSLMGSPNAQALAEIGGEMVAEARDLHQQAVGHRFVVVARLIAGDRQGFDAEVRELERCARELRMWLFREQIVRCRLTAAFLDARFAEADGRLAELLEVHGPAGTPNGVTAIKASPLFEEGRFEDIDALEPPAPMVLAPMVLATRAHGAVETGRFDDARSAVRAAMHDMRRAPPYLAVMASALLAEVVYALDDSRIAPLLRGHLEPYAGLVLVIGFGAQCLGPADRPLGMVAALLGEEEAADGHFETALRVSTSLRSPLFLAHSQCDYGRFLLRRGGAGDEARARDLLSAAAVTAERLGMRTLARRASRLLS